MIPKVENTQPTTVPYTCRTWLSGELIPIDDYAREFTVTAPSRVRPKAVYLTTFDPAPIYPVPLFNQEIVDVQVSYALPANAQILAYWLVGAAPGDSVSAVGNELTVHSAGPKPGGVEFDLPTLQVLMRAPASGTLIAAPAGSSYDHLSFGWNRLHPDTQEWDLFECYVDPADEVVFTHTQVGSL